MVDFLFLVVGIALLTFGGEALIRGALSAAQRLGISPLLSGLLIVGFGTSAPELVVSISAAINGQADIAVGNVVGSNIANVLLVLGLCALISPMTVQPLALKRDANVVIGASVLFIVLAYSAGISVVDGLILFGVLAMYLVWAYMTERHQTTPVAQMHEQEASEVSAVPSSIPMTIGYVVVGLALLIIGSRILITGATGIALSLGVSEAVIGLTLVAVGTSLPELTVSIMAAIRRHADVAVGNILGSNIFNLLGILGVSAVLQPLPIHERILAFDQWVMLAAAVILTVFLWTGRKLQRWEGGVLLVGYVAYLGFGLSF